jgi:hypothetical protein
MTIKDLMDQQTGGGKGLLAAEIMQKTNRTHGPVDGNCEVCGNAAESFVLQDWINWHCFPCAEKALRAEFAR